MSKTVAFIPVRGGSKSIPLKNIKMLCGEPLVYWTAAAADACEAIDEVYVATDSEEIRQTVIGFGLPKIRVIGRSAESASDTASTESAMLEFAQAHLFDNIVLIQATSPLLSVDDLEAGFKEFEREGVDSVLSVVENKRFFWRNTDSGAQPTNYDFYARPRRQDFDGCYMENGAFYITSRKRLLETSNRISGNIAISVMSEDTAYEIDEPSDWPIVEMLLARRTQLPPCDIDFAPVEMLLTDCDGCLTDAGMYYSEDGLELKKFNTRDGMAFRMLKEQGIKVGIITGEKSQAAQRRGEKLRADHIVLDCNNKLEAAKKICAEEGIDLAHVAYIGDDINDVALLQAVGFPCCPADAQPQVKTYAKYIAKSCGGQGVVREVAEHVLNAGE